MRQITLPKGSFRKVNIAASPRHEVPLVPREKPAAPRPAATGSISNETSRLREAAAAIEQIRLSAQRELEMARQMRAQAQRYQQETESMARSQAQQLILRTRLATQREVEELIRNASAEIQKVLADIRVIRITAQEELAAQRSFTNAARISSLSLEVKKAPKGSTEKKKKPTEKK